MSIAVFGPGSLYITRNDITNQTPVNVGFANEFSYDESGEQKQLYGQNQYPLVSARGTIKATGKIKAAKISGIALDAAFHGIAFTTGSLVMVQNEGPTPIPTTPFQIVVTHGANFDTDLGVINSATGLPLAKVPLATTPVAGQYHVDPSTGTYTFSSADNVSGISVQITYAYKAASTGQTLTVTNQPIGVNPTFQLDYSSTLNGVPYYIRFFSCVADKLVRAHKLTDFMMPEIDFGFYANAAGQVYSVAYPEVS